MISTALITRAAIDMINHLGIGYRVRLAQIEYIDGSDSNSKEIKSRIDVKIYDSSINQTALIQIDNLGIGEEADPKKNSSDIKIDDLPATVLEDYPETTIPDSWLKRINPNKTNETNETNETEEFLIDENSVSENFRQILDKAETNDGEGSNFTTHHKADLRDGFKVYDINVDDAGQKVISDVNDLSYSSLCAIFEDVLKEMMAVTMFSVN